MTAPAGVNLTDVGISIRTAEDYSYSAWGQVADDGSYSFTGLPAGSYKVQFTGNNSGSVDQWYAGATSFDSATPVTLAAGQILTGIDASLVKGASINGHVTVPAGIDTSSVSVYVSNTAYGPDWYSGYGQVGQDGSYAVRGLPAGNYQIQFSGGNSGVITQWHSGASSSESATPVTLTAGQDLNGINATLVMGGSISGNVTIPAGVDTGSLQADVMAVDGGYSGSSHIAADGTYKVNGLPAGSYKVRFSGYNSGTLEQWYSGASQATATPVTLAAGEDRTGVDAILVKGASISGKVTAPAGVNPASIQATVYQAGGTNPNYVASSSVNDDGTYKVVGLPSGSYKVQFAGYNTGALVQWYAGAASFEAATPVTLTAGQDHVGVNATLVKGASISGKVTAPAGINLSGVQAYLYTSDSYYSFAASVDVAADGSYNFAGLAAGSYKVQFAAGSSGALDQWYGGLSHSAATTVPVSDSQDLALSDTPLTKGATISGTVTAPAGVNLSAVTARVYNADNLRAYAVTAQVQADGTYRVTGLRAGNYKVQFSGYDTGALTQWYASGTTMETATLLPLTAGQDLTGIDATLTKGASIAGKITVPAGVDLTMVNVSATAEGSSYGMYGQVNADGTYAIKGLVAGTYKVKFASYNSGALDEWYNNVQTAAEATPITLTLGEDRTAVDATLAKGAAISGKVTLPAAGYSSEAYITAYKASDNSMAGSTWANADGTYSLRGLLPGNYKISFSAFGTGALPQWYKNASSIDTATTVPVTEGQDVTAIDATLIKGGTISGKITAPAGTNLNASQIIATKNGASNAAPAYGYVNPDGTYSVIGLEAGTYTVRFSGGQSGAADTWHGGATAASATPVTVTVSQTVTGVDMTAVTGASIQGKVTGASTATGYLVSVLDNSGKTVKNGVSDPSGNYSVVGLAEGSYKVAFNRSSGYSLEEAQFFQNKPESAGVGQAQSIPVTPGQPVQNIDATLTSGGSVTGTLLNKEGKPFSAFVQAYTTDGSLVTRAGLSDADGKYTIKGLTSGNYILRVSGGPVTGDLYSGNAATEATATPVTVTSGNATTHDLSYASGSLTAPVPTITGTAKEGSTLTAVPGTWAPEGVALTYQWKSNGTAVGLAIAGATASTYKLTAADVGKTITVTVTGTKGGYTTAAQTSARTATVMALNPVLTAPIPAITGTAKVGSTMTAAPGTWGPGHVVLGYQWKANGIAITGATASTYKPAAADVAKTLTVTVTGTRAGYTTAAKTSAATAKVALGTLTSPVPAIAGAAKVGSTLTAAGTWGPAPVTLKYQWKANGIAITGATASTYKPAATLLGKALTVTVTGSKAGYTAVTKTSAATAKVAAGTLTAPVPVITGTAKVGYVLTATGTWGPAPVTLKYQWKANGIAITGATASTYRPVSAVVGKTLAVTVTGAKAAYTTVAKTSAATVKVAAGTLTAPLPRITGIAKVGSILTAVPGTWGPAPVTLKYQWKANGIAITGATASTYKPTTATRGKTLTVTVTGAKSGYTAAAKTSAATVKVV